MTEEEEGRLLVEQRRLNKESQTLREQLQAHGKRVEELGRRLQMTHHQEVIFLNPPDELAIDPQHLTQAAPTRPPWETVEWSQVRLEDIAIKMRELRAKNHRLDEIKRLLGA